MKTLPSIDKRLTAVLLVGLVNKTKPYKVNLYSHGPSYEKVMRGTFDSAETPLLNLDDRVLEKGSNNP